MAASAAALAMRDCAIQRIKSHQPLGLTALSREKLAIRTHWSAMWWRVRLDVTVER